VPDQDIKIKIIGCRPGEKLYEELFDSSESRIESGIEGVFGAVSTPVNLDILRLAFAELKQAAEIGDLEKLFSTVTRVLPNYSKPEAVNKTFRFGSNVFDTLQAPTGNQVQLPA
jgi:FlaA1/EpsC-like NDP-sugar epimerase